MPRNCPVTSCPCCPGNDWRQPHSWLHDKSEMDLDFASSSYSTSRNTGRYRLPLIWALFLFSYRVSTYSSITALHVCSWGYGSKPNHGSRTFTIREQSVQHSTED